MAHYKLDYHYQDLCSLLNGLGKESDPAKKNIINNLEKKGSYNLVIKKL